MELYDVIGAKREEQLVVKLLPTATSEPNYGGSVWMHSWL